MHQVIAPLYTYVHVGAMGEHRRDLPMSSLLFLELSTIAVNGDLNTPGSSTHESLGDRTVSEGIHRHLYAPLSIVY